VNRLVSFGSSPIISPSVDKDDALPGIISKHLGLHHFSACKPRTSNSKITRKILTHDYLDDDIVFVSWSTLSRFEFKTEQGWAGITMKGNYQNLENSFREIWFNGPGQWEYTHVMTTLREILTAQTFLKESNRPYLFIFDNNEYYNSELVKNPDTYLKTLINLINWDNFIDFDRRGFMPWVDNLDIIDVDRVDYHPGLLGHQIAADYIMSHKNFLNFKPNFYKQG
jgi:hypothetical protein